MTHTPRSFHTTPAMLIGIYHLPLVTAAQRTRLHYRPGMLKTVKARLKRGTDTGYVQADSIPTRRLRSPYYYAPADKGIHHLAASGLDVDSGFLASKEAGKHSLFITHALELNDILIAALNLKAIDQRYYLARFMHERVLKSNPSRPSRACVG